MTIAVTPIIIAKAHGKLREGLASLLENQPAAHMIDLVEDENALFQKLKEYSEHCVFIIDIDLLGKNALKALKNIRTDFPGTNSILLVNTFSQKKSALSAGFYHILIKGFNANDLLEQVRQVQTENPVQNNLNTNSQGFNK